MSTLVGAGARGAERGLTALRAGVARLLDRVQLRLHAASVARDPDAQAWAAEMKAKVRDGSIWADANATSGS